ncbi:hypothetical protein CRG98_014657 [Punica granatum]|uniref:RNase H type-1 domain-containing protein n=1 Tax=Punica granatum TaxID=22663 RepID=A0A2I0KA00_PUNGR|nr:hypothetical protein CRG98_014657 [Punica granatum]
MWHSRLENQYLRGICYNAPWIETLKGDDGEWVDDEACLRQLTVSHFSRLYGEDSARGACMTESRFPELLIEVGAALSVGVTIEEVRKALFNMPPFRAPGPDGYRAVFYQTNWDIICHSFLDFVRSVFEGGRSVAAMNSTLIAMIPKVQVPETIHQFHPISLCNVSYKITTKIVANRLQKYMPSLISPYRSSFIPGRHIQDNIIVAQELIHYMRRMKRKKGFMALKIDLEKAYDRLSWDFLNATLSLAAFEDQILEIMRILDVFCGASGQKVSPAMSVIHFSRNVVDPIRSAICHHCSFTPIDELGRYLGIPIVHGRVRKSHFQNVVARVWNRLSGWSTSSLSMAGRTTLIKLDFPISRGCGRLYGRGRAHNVFDFSYGGLQEKAFSRTKLVSRDISVPLLTVHVATWAPNRHYMPSETEWLLSNLGQPFHSNWPSIFAMSCWLIWSWRNKVLFDPDISYPESGTQAIIRTALGFQESWAAARAVGGGSNKDWMDIRWLKPPEDFLKLNTGGSVRGNPGIAGAGALIRNDSGGWVIGFVQNIRITSVTMTELWGVLTGLELAWNLGFWKVILEVDSLVVRNFISGEGNYAPTFQAPLQRIKELYRRT